jgi:hypothetical protein
MIGYVLNFAVIVVLLEDITPFAVAWFIIAVFIYAVKSCTIRPFTHVGQKIDKALAALPSFANKDTTAAVIWVTRHAGIFAPTGHTPPTAIGRGFCHLAILTGRMSVVCNEFLDSFNRTHGYMITHVTREVNKRLADG